MQFPTDVKIWLYHRNYARHTRTLRHHAVL